MGRPAETILLHPAYSELAQTFYTHLLHLGYSSQGCKNKWRRVKEFLRFAESSVSTDITAITTKDIISYYEQLQQRPSKRDGKPITEKTVIDCIRAIQDLYEMLQNKGQVQINPTNTLQISYPEQTTTRTALTQAEIQELYKHAGTLQERAILGLAYGCGLRVNELELCNTENVRLREGILIVPKGKGNKGRIVPMCKALVKDLANYFFKVRLPQQSKTPKAFILNNKGGRMQKETYNKRLKKLIDRTGNEALKTKQVTIHTMRHSIATHLIENGIPLEKVKEFLGHSQLETTEIYTHISQTQLQKLVE